MIKRPGELQRCALRGYHPFRGTSLAGRDCLGRHWLTGHELASHLLELLAGGQLLGEERGLDAVEEALQPADELGLGHPQLGFGRHLAVGERRGSSRSSAWRSGERAPASASTEVP